MKILIEREIAIKLKYYTHFAKGEISGMGKSIINEDGNIQVVDIALFDQECTGAHTEIDDGSLAKFMRDIRQRGEDLKNWNLWWHTHADFGVFWSGTDEGCIKNHKDNNEYLVSVVTNKAGDFLGRLDIFPKDNSPFGKEFAPVRYDCNVEYFVDTEEKKRVEEKTDELELEKSQMEDYIKKINEEIKELDESLLSDDSLKVGCKDEVEEKVREKVYTQKIYKRYSDWSNWNYNGYGKKSKKKENYYESDESKQKEFENALDDILWGYPVYDEELDYDLEDENLDGMKHCPECQNPIIYCDCTDAIEKWGEELGLCSTEFDDYLDNKYNKRLALDDYADNFNDHGRFKGWQNNILPIIYNNGKKTR